MELLKDLEFNNVKINIFLIENNKKKIKIIPKLKKTYIPNSECITKYPLSLIEKIIKVKTPVWVCDEIMREESEFYNLSIIKNGLLSYFTPKYFEKKYILDFGCGCGASTIVLKKLLPDSNILGLDIIPEFIEIANLRKNFYEFSGINFALSETPDTLEKVDKMFDFIVLNGVFEHFLPDERKNLFIKLWEKLKLDGVLFINDTPCKYFPIETHTTRLPFLSYLPDSLAYLYAKMISPKILPNETWESLLKAGIRGTSPREIKRILSQNNKKYLMLKPHYLNNKDLIDIWFNSYKGISYTRKKKIIYYLSKPIYCFLRIPFIPYLSLAIKKIE